MPNFVGHVGQINEAEFEGVKVTRQEHLFVMEFRALIPTAPYDDHFVFEVPKSRKRAGLSEYLCTCGANAVVATPEKESGRMFVCLFNATYGYHQTSAINLKDYQEAAAQGEVLEAKGRKWLI